MPGGCGGNAAPLAPQPLLLPAASKAAAEDEDEDKEAGGAHVGALVGGRPPASRRWVYPERPGPPEHLDRGMLRRLRQASGSAELMRLFAQADPQLVQYFRDGGTVGSDSDPESPGRADPSMLDAQVGSGMDTTLDGI